MKLLLQLTGLLSVATAGFAGQHNIHKNRAAHQELAKREPGHVSLHKRFEGSKWSYYDGHTGQACVSRFSSLSTPRFGVLRRVLRPKLTQAWFCIFSSGACGEFISNDDFVSGDI